MRANLFKAAISACLLWVLASIAQADIFPTDRFELSGASVARHLEDRNNVAVFEFTGNYNGNLSSGGLNAEPRAVVAREFFRTHPDDYDFLVVFTSFEFDSKGWRALCIPVRNDVSGIGREIFDNSDLFGSNSRLRGYVDMAAMTRFVHNPLAPEFDQVMVTMAHELLHAWGAKVRFRKNGVLRDDLIGQSNAHWSYLLDTGGSVHYGANWRDNGDGTFSSTGVTSFYSPLDLYLMGLLRKEEVPPFYLINNAQADKTRINQLNETVSGTREEITIDDVIAAEGVRVPDSEHSQKTFRVAYALLVPPGKSAESADIAAINSVREHFTTRFAAMTGGRGIIQSLPKAVDNVTTGTADVVSSNEDFASGQNLTPALDWLQAQQNNGRWADKNATAIRDTISAYVTLVQYAPGFPGAQAARDWLAANPGRNTDYLARYTILLKAAAPGDATAQIQALRALQNSDGGWGLGKGFSSDPLDTALAIQALANSGYPADVTRGVDYLASVRNADGSWGASSKGRARLQTTVEVVRALLASNAASAQLQPSLAWLAGRQQSDGGFGDGASSAHETALALQLFIAAQRLDLVNADKAVRFLLSRQRSGGSWDGSVYATATAISAIKNFSYPNWAVTGITAEPGAITDGARVQFNVAVTNTAGTPASASTLALYDGDPAQGGQRIDLVAVPPLGPGVTQSVPVYWDSLDRSGAHSFYAVVDPDIVNLESTRGDNTGVLNTTVAAAPAQADLEVVGTGILVTPGKPAQLPADLSITAQVRNLGQATATQASIQLWAVYQGNATLVSEVTRDVLGRSTLPVNFTYQLTTAGPVRFEVRIDAANAIAESSEQNNVAGLDLDTQPSIDLKVASADIGLPSAAVFSGQQITLPVVLHNAGTLASPSAKMHFRLSNGTEFRDLPTVDVAIGAGSTVTQQLNWLVNMTGTITVSVMMDPEGKIAELEEGNNTAVASFTAAPFLGPNLSVRYQDFTLTPTPANELGAVHLQALVANSGLTDASNVKVAFYNGDPAQGGQGIGEVVLPVVAAGAKVAAVFDWASLPDGADKLVFVVVDPDGTVNEFQREDNRAFNVLPVNTLPDLAVVSSDIRFTPSLPAPGEKVGVSVQIANLGEQPALDLPVQVRDGNGNVVHATRIAHVAPKSVTTFAFAWQSAAAGTADLIVEIDPAQERSERFRQNNLASRSISVQSADFFVNERYISPNGDGVQDSVTVSYRLDAPNQLRIEFVDDAGAVRYSETRQPGALTGEFVWTGHETGGAIAADGTYSVRLFGAQGQIGQQTVIVDRNKASLYSIAGTPFEYREDLTCNALYFPDLYWSWQKGESVLNVERPSQSRLTEFKRFKLDTQETATLLSDLYSGSASYDRKPYIDAVAPDGGMVYFTYEFDYICTNWWCPYNDYSESYKLDTRSKRVSPLPADIRVSEVTNDSNVVIAYERLSSGGYRQIKYNLLTDQRTPLPFAGLASSQASPDGRIFVGQDQYSYDWIYLYDVAAGTSRRVELTPAPNSNYTYDDAYWSPDGTKLVMWGSDVINVVDVESATVTAAFYPKLNSADQEAYFNWGTKVSWSSDSKSFTFDEIAYDYSSDDWSTAGVISVFNVETNTRTDVIDLVAISEDEWDADPQAYEVRVEALIAEGKLPGHNENGIVKWMPGENTLLYQPSVADRGTTYLLKVGGEFGIRKIQEGIYTLWDSNEVMLQGRTRRFYVDDASLECQSNYNPKYDQDDWYFSDTPNDIWEQRNLASLTAVLKARVVGGSGVRLSGIAQDINFASYRLEYASAESPDSWHPIVTGGGNSPVVNEVFSFWVPDVPGTYNVRLTVTDLAGNSTSTTRPVKWNKTAPITDVYRDHEAISPNGDGFKDTVTVHYRVLEPTQVSLRVFDSKGNQVIDLSRSHSIIGEEVNVAWNGRNSLGNIVSDGTYTIRINSIELRVAIDNTAPQLGLTTLPLLQVYTRNNNNQDYVRQRAPLLLKAGQSEARLELAEKDRDNWVEFITADAEKIVVPPHMMRGRRARLTAADAAGNRASVVTPVYAEQVVLSHSYNLSASNVTHPMDHWQEIPAPSRTYGINVSGGGGVFLLQHTLFEPVALVTAQIAPLPASGLVPAESEWLDVEVHRGNQPTTAEVPSALDLPEAIPVELPTPVLPESFGNRFLARFTLIDTDGKRFTSNSIMLFKSGVSLSVGYCGKAQACQTKPFAMFYKTEEVDPPVALEMLVSKDDQKWTSWGPAELRPVTATEQGEIFFPATEPGVSRGPLGTAWVARGDFEACQTYKVRLVGKRQSGADYFGEDGAPIKAPCLKVNVVSKPVPAESCDVPAPEKQRITVDIAGGLDKAPLKLIEVFRRRADQSEDVLLTSNVPVYGANNFEFDIRPFQAGATLPLEVRVTDVDGREVVRGLPLYVDKLPPKIDIGYPEEDQKICHAAEVAGRIWDDGEAEYTVAVVADRQASKLDAPQDGKSLKSAIFDGSLARVSGGMGPQTLKFDISDSGGYRVCATRRFEIDGLVEFGALGVSGEGVSPNGDDVHDSLTLTYRPGEALAINSRVYQFLGRNSVDGTPILGQLVANWTLNAVTADATDHVWEGRDNGGQVLADGDYIIETSYQDACGNQASTFSQVVYVDRTAPDITLTTPLAGATVGSMLRTEGKVTDAHPAQTQLTYLAAAATDADVLGELALRQPVSPATVLHNWAVPEGLATFGLRLVATDRVGNSREILLPLQARQDVRLLGQIAATPELFSPNQDGRLEQVALGVQVVRDSQLNVIVRNSAGVLVRTLATAAVAAAGSSPEFVWDGLQGDGTLAADGTYQLEVTAAEQGNPSFVQTETVAVELDRTTPLITLQQPAQGYVNRQVGIAATVQDNRFASYRLFVAPQADFPLWQLLGEGDSALIRAEAEALGTLAEGNYRLRIEARDEAENVSYHEAAFTIDQTAPVVEILAPLTDALIDSGSLSLRSTLDEKNLDSFQVALWPEASPAQSETLLSGTTLTGTELNTQLVLGTRPEGRYVLRVLARDKAGNETADSVTLEVDVTAPVVTITAPAEGAYVREATTVTGQIAEGHLQSHELLMASEADAARERWTLLQTGTGLESGGAYAFALDALPQDGRYVLAVRAKDKAGLTARSERTVVFDTQAPEKPQAVALDVENGNQVRLSWNASTSGDVTGYRIYRDGMPLTGPPVSGVEFVDSPAPEGTHVYEVAAFDAAGWESARSDSVSTLIDTIAPTVSITAPQDQSVINGYAVLSGSAYSTTDDFKEYRVLYSTDGSSWQLLRRETDAVISGTLADLQIPGVSHGAGYQLRVEAEDIHGNIATASRTFTLDTQGPTDTPTLTVTQSGEVVLSWTTSSAPDLAGYLLYRNGGLANGPRDLPAELEPYLLGATTFREIMLADGSYEYTVQAMDKAGNTGPMSAPVQRTVNLAVPIIALIEPEPELVFESTAPVRVATRDQDITSLVLQYSDASRSNWTSLSTHGPDQLTWTFDPAQIAGGLPFGLYYLRVQATDTAGQVGYTGEAGVYYNTVPSRLTGLTASVDQGDVTLNWTAAAGQLSEYRVYRRLDNGNWYLLDSLDPSTTSFVASEGEGLHRFAVTAVDIFGHESAKDAVVDALVFSPYVDDGLVYSPALAGTLMLSASTPVAGTLTFTLYQPDDTVVTRSVAANANTPVFVDDLPLAVGVNWIEIQATDAQGNRSYIWYLAVTGGVAPATPADVVAEPDAEAGVVRLHWTPGTETDLLGYRLYRNDEPLDADVPVTIENAYANMNGWNLPSAITDDDEWSYWAGDDVNETGFLGLQWTETVPVNSIDIDWYQYSMPPAEFEVWGWEPEAQTYIRVAKVTGNQTRQTRLQLARPFVTNQLHLRIPRVSSSGEVQQSAIAEIDVKAVALRTVTELELPLADGRWTYAVSAINQRAFESLPGAAAQFEFGDVEGPAAVSLAGTAGTDRISLSWTASASGDVAGYRVFRDGVQFGDTADLLFSDDQLGVHTYTVKPYDAVGNLGAASNSVTLTLVDTQPLQLTFLSPTSAGKPLQVQDAVVDIGGLTRPGATVDLLVNGSPVASGVALGTASMDLETNAETAAQLGVEPDEIYQAVPSPDGRFTAVWVAQNDEVRLIERATGSVSIVGRISSGNGDLKWARDSNVLGVIDSGASTPYVLVHDVARNETRRFDMGQGSWLSRWSFTLSPSGTKWSVSCDCHKPDDSWQTGVFVADLESGATRILPVEYPGPSSWSPDEARIAVLDGESGKVIELQTATILQDLGDVWTDPEWSPDGKSLAFATENGLEVQDVASGNRRVVYPDPDYWWDGQPRWSPDSHYLTFAAPLDDNGGYGAVMVDAETGALTALAEVDNSEFDFWSSTWAQNGDIQFVNYGTGLLRITPAGIVRFEDVQLDIGDNIVGGIARRGGAIGSAPPILLTRKGEPRPDLELLSSGVTVLPGVPHPGEALRISAALKNSGELPAANVRLKLTVIDPAGAVVVETNRDIGALAAGQRSVQAFDLTLPMQAGHYTVLLDADPDFRILENSEANNTVIRDLLAVEGSEPVVSLTLSGSEFGFGEAVGIDVRAALPEGTRSGRVGIDVLDTEGVLVTGLLDQATTLDSTRAFSHHVDWDAREVFAGDYLVRVRWIDGSGNVQSEAQAPFKLRGEGRFSATVASGKSRYTTGEEVAINGTATYSAGNQTISGATARVRIETLTGETVYEQTRSLGDWLVGNSLQQAIAWSPGSTNSGTFRMTFEVVLGGSRLAGAESTFEVAAVASVQGDLTLEGTRIDVGSRQRAGYQLRNDSAADAGQVNVRLQLVDVQRNTVLAEHSVVHALAAGSTASGSHDFATQQLGLNTYEVRLEIMPASGTVQLLDRETFQIVDRLPPELTVLAPQADASSNTAFMQVRAQATDAFTRVARVEISVDGQAWVAIPSEATGEQLSSYYSGATGSLASGVHQLRVRALDIVGNVTESAPITFTVSSTTQDTTPPTITVTGVAHNAAYAAAVTPVITVQDANLATQSITLDGQPFVSGTAISSEGTHVLHVAAADTAGNSAERDVSFLIDLTTPVVAVSGVSEGTAYNTAVTPVVTLTEANLKQQSLTLNGQPFTSGTAVTVEGNYTLVATAEDTTGHVTSVTVHFSIDTTAPVITVTGVADNGSYNTAVTPVVAVVEANVASQSLTLDGQPFTSGTEVAADGEHMLQVSVTDAAGNTATQTVGFRIDTTLPLIAFSGVVDGGAYSATVTPVITITEANPASQTITLDGQPFTSGTVVSAEGEHVLQASVTDVAGNVAEKVAAFRIDTTAPVISISGVADDASYNTAVTPVVDIADANLVVQNITLNGQPFVSGTAVAGEGSYTLEVSAEDAVGHLANRSLSFRVDSSAPAITVTGVANGASYTAAVTPVVAISDAQLASQNITLDGQPFTSGTTVSGEGTHVLQVAATDVAGNSSTASISFTLDLKAPAISISGVSDNGVYAAAVTPVVSIADDHLAQSSVLLDGQPYVAGTPVDSEGSHVLVASAQDEAGNSSSRSVTFLLDLTAPVVAVTGVANGGLYTGSVTPVITVTEANQASQSLTLNGQPYVSGTAITADGSYTLVVAAEDTAGHATSVTVAFTLDSAAPVIAITGVAQGQLYGAAVTPVVSISDTNLASQGITLDSQPFVSGTTVNAEGNHVLQVTAADTAGNTSQQTVGFALDLTAPGITVSGVSNGAAYAAAVTPVVSISDAHLVQQTLTLNGHPFVSGTPVTGEGSYTLVVDAEDGAGHSSSVSVGFVIDSVAPVITVSGVGDGAAYAAPVTPSVTIADANLATQSIMLDGQPFTSGTAVTAEGAHALQVTATDAPGNHSEREVGFLIDLTAPVVTVSGVSNGASYNAAVTPVVTITEANLATQNLTLNGQPFTPGTSVTGEGNYVLVAGAEDRAGHVTSVSVSFTVDTTAPVITVSGVSADAVYANSVTPVIALSDAHLTQQAITLNGQPFVSGTAITVEGDYQLVITAQDGAGNSASQTLAFSLDLTAPVLTVGGVSNGTAYKTAVTPVITLTEANLAQQSLTLNGQPFTSGTTVSTEGSYTLVATAEDTAGHVTSVTVGFSIDASAPVITVTGITAGAGYNAAVTPVITIADVNPASQGITLDGQPFTSGTAVSAEGSHVLHVTATDAAGNSSEITVDFALDLTAPVVSISGVVDGQLYGAAVSPVVSISEANLATQSLTLDGQPFVSGTAVSTEGDHVLQASATDAVGNTTQRTVNFALDLTAPAVAVSGVTNGSFYNAAVTPVISIADANLVQQSVTLNGQPFVSGTAVAGEGSYSLVATATDGAGHATTVSVSFTLDTAAPVISVSGVADNAAYAAAVTPVIGIVDANLATQDITLDGQPFTSGTAVATEGMHALQVSASDAAGNHSERNVGFLVDLTAPSVTVSGVSNAASYNTAVTPVVSISDANLTQQSLTLNGQPFTSGTAVSAEGSYTLVASAEDRVGHVTSVSVGFSIDTTAPAIAISGIAANGLYNTAVTPVIAISDAHLAAQAITLDGQPFTSGTVVSGEGTHVLEVTATDAAGNSSTQSVSFALDLTAPTVTVSGVATNGMYAAAVTPVISIADANLAQQAITLNGQPFVSGTAITVEGDYQLVIMAQDGAGNSASQTLAFTLDLTAPAVAVSGVSEGTAYNTSVTPVVSITETNLRQQSLTLNGQPFTSGTAVTAEVSYTLVATAEDKADHVTSVTVHFSIDTTAPVITVTGVANNGSYNTAVTPVVAIVEANVASQSLTLDGQPFTSGTAVSAEGLHVLRATVTDTAGNSTVREVGFGIDTTAPVIGISGVADGANYSATVTPVVTITEANLATQNLTLNGQPYVSGTALSADGSYTLSVSAQDTAGNSTSRSLTFSIATPVVLAGQLTVTPAQLPVGDSVVLSAVVNNQGAQAQQLLLRLRVTSVTNPQNVTVRETTQTIAAGQSYTWAQSVLPTGVAGDQFQVELLAVKGTQTFNLATGGFTLAAAAVQGDLAVTTRSADATLVMLNCNPTWLSWIFGQPNSCYETRAAELRSRFDSLGISYRIVFSESEFRAEMRSGRYGAYWLLGHIGPCSDTLAAELREAVNRGATLLVDGGFRSWNNWPLSDVTGGKYDGYIDFSRDEFQVMGPNFTAGTMQSAGYNPVRLQQVGGTVEARYSGSLAVWVWDVFGLPTIFRSSYYPAVISNSYGSGRAVITAFDLVDSLRANPSSTAWTRLFTETSTYLTPATPLRYAGSEPVKVEVTVSNTGSNSGSFTVKTQLPAGMTLLDSSVPVQTGSAGLLEFNVSLAAGAQRKVVLTVAAGTVSGDYRMEYELYGNAGATQVLQKRQSVTVTARGWRENYGDADAALRGLSLGTFADTVNRSSALSSLSLSRWYFEQNMHDSAINELVKAIGYVRQIKTANIGPARLSMDLLLREYEIAW